MLKVMATFCQHCETARFDSNLDGRCRFCNTPLYEKEVELPELSSSKREEAVRFLEKNRSTGFSTTTIEVLSESNSTHLH